MENLVKDRHPYYIFVKHKMHLITIETLSQKKEPTKVLRSNWIEITKLSTHKN